MNEQADSNDYEFTVQSPNIRHALPPTSNHLATPLLSSNFSVCWKIDVTCFHQTKIDVY